LFCSTLWHIVRFLSSLERKAQLIVIQGEIVIIFTSNCVKLYNSLIPITTPSLVVSMIMVEAYKKFILVALILDGKVPTLPKYTSQVVSRVFKHFIRHYNELASAYSTNNPDVFSTVIARHRDIYIRVIV